MAGTRERIVMATAELFRSQGYNGTSLKQVTENAAAPTGSLYHFFPGGKNELGVTVIRESGSAYLALFELIADEAQNIAEAVGAFFDGASAALEETDYIDICAIGTVAREVASTHDELRRATVDVFDSWTAAVGNRLVTGGVPPAVAESLADTVISALEGGFILARARRSCTGLRATGSHMQHMVEAAIAAAR